MRRNPVKWLADFSELAVGVGVLLAVFLAYLVGLGLAAGVIVFVAKWVWSWS